METELNLWRDECPETVYVECEDPDQTARMRSLILIFAFRVRVKSLFIWLRPKYKTKTYQNHSDDSELSNLHYTSQFDLQYPCKLFV